jgi:predicted ferric reductase
MAGLHILFISSDVSRDPFLRNYLLIWTGIGLFAFVYRTLMPKIFIRQFEYRVEKVNVVGGNVVELIMQPITNEMSFEPGQFVFIKFLHTGVAGITTEAHPFSISSSPKDPFLRLSAKALGDYTTALMNIKPGAIAEIEGAYGKFSYRNYKSVDQIWIGGGIGITPFLSMARSLVPGDLKVDLYYSVKSTAEFVDFETLASLVPQLNNKFRVIPWVADERGFLTADAVEKESGGITGKDIFICGPPMMMKAMREQLRTKGVPNSMIHSEEFSMS